MTVESLGTYRTHHRSLEGARILVVDDDATVRAILRQYLENAGSSVTEAISGEEALQHLDNDQFDIILLDILMPNIVGLEVLKAVRQKYSMSQLPVIMVTVNEESADVVEALSLGANDYIVKPVIFDVLRARIERYLSYKQVEEELRQAREVLEQRIQERTAELLTTNKSLEREISERKQIGEENRKLSLAVEASSSIMIITDLDGTMEYVNPRFTEVTGYSKKEAIGRNASLLQSGEASENTYVEMWKTITSGGTWKGEFHNQKKDGSFYWGRSSITGVKDATGKITHFISNQEDVTHEYELSEQLSYQASHDALTGLVNRREFERRAERLLASIRQEQSEHALCYMDLDQFKVVNDTCGHTAGDEMLRQLSIALQGAVRKRDTLARLGGDEFGVLMEHCSPDHAHRVASTLQKVMQDYQFVWEGHVFKVGVSIGLVAITETFANLTELMKQADAACYMAKDMGRNRIHVYHGDDVSLAQRHGEMQWVTRIYQALEQNRFCLFAQTIVPLGGGHDKHYELLLRMQDEVGQLIPPGAFLPAAERYNLIEQLDTWVIENAFTLLAANPAFLNQIHFVSINLSGQSLTKTDFLNFIIAALAKYDIEASKICFEITETTAISNLRLASTFITTLKDLGCQFALDDFGSGLSSFAYLKNLRVDYLKIDGMFVKDIVDDPIDHAMVKSINEIGHLMGMQTIAEFVENDKIKGMLREIGVDYAQGHGICKPQSFVELLEQSSNVTDINSPEDDE